VGRASYTQQLLDRATTYVEQPLAARRYAEGMAEVSALYAEITGEPISSCRQCQYSNYLAVVTAYIREATRFLHPETMADSNYTFASQFANEQIADGRYSKVVTAETLTDKDAEALIKLGYGHVIVKKGGKEEAAAEGESKSTTSEAETKAKADLATAKADLKTEKEAHGVTKKELAKVQKQLADAQKQLEKAQTPTSTSGPSMTASTNTPAPTAPEVPAAPAEGTQA
jgi:phosphatidylserine decarboxylase